VPQGYEVYKAYSGQEGLEKVLEKGIDLILLDMMMPGLDGYEVTRRLRANPQIAHTRECYHPKCFYAPRGYFRLPYRETGKIYWQNKTMRKE